MSLTVWDCVAVAGVLLITLLVLGLWWRLLLWLRQQERTADERAHLESLAEYWGLETIPGETIAQLRLRLMAQVKGNPYPRTLL